MKRLVLYLVCILLTSLVKAQSGQEVFWSELKKLCGKTFDGKIIVAPPNDTAFANKKLQMHIRACEEEKIYIPFHVGTNYSRTWVLSKVAGRILLKHDHRHEDGSPDKITMYGGLATNSGTNTMLVFPADQETVTLLPRAANNVWWMSLVPGKSFTYNLRVMGSDRQFSIEFDLTKEMPTAPAPWGWKE